MAHPSSPQNLEDLRRFQFERVLNEDPLTHSIALLGSLAKDGQDRVQAIIRLEKTALEANNAARYFAKDGVVQRVELEESTDIVGVS